jgi:hypothetical protein
MKDLFTKTLAVCAAASCFGIGAYTGALGIESIASSKVKAEIAADKAMQVVDEVVLTPKNAVKR